MKIKAIIGLSVASLCIGCSSVSSLATDDVYYWPEAHHVTTNSASTTSDTGSSSTSSSSSSSSSSGSSVEYLNVQDTVVTIRVKK